MARGVEDNVQGTSLLLLTRHRVLHEHEVAHV